MNRWVFARHSVEYNELPDYFIAFDIYDCQAQKFLSRKDFHQRLKDTSIATIPTIATITTIATIATIATIGEWTEIWAVFGGKSKGGNMHRTNTHRA